jgi:acyl-CoA thioester hydrolase
VTRRGSATYFEREADAPLPLTVSVPRRVRFSEADPMGIAWYGRYANYFEEGAAELGRRGGLSYQAFMEAGLRAPIVRFHVDYAQPLFLDEEFTILASMVWHEGARLNTEFTLRKGSGGVAATAYTVQLFVHADSGEVCLVSPPLLERFRRRWRAGEFVWTQP